MPGIITFSSSCPAWAPHATVVSFPITWKQTWLTISTIAGFTLPGMIDEPGRTAGITSSPKPVRGPRLHEVRVLPGLRGENIGELVQLLAQRLRELEVRQAHRSRHHVVGRLAHVHVIVGTHVLVGAEAPAADLVRAIGDDLVDV